MSLRFRRPYDPTEVTALFGASVIVEHLCARASRAAAQGLTMPAPSVIIDLDVIAENTRRVTGWLDPQGIGMFGVTKAACGSPLVARAMLRGGGCRPGQLAPRQCAATAPQRHYSADHDAAHSLRHRGAGGGAALRRQPQLGSRGARRAGRKRPRNRALSTTSS